MVSRRDVAREAGVSPTSVSYYINQSGYVSKEASEKIQKAIDKLHYSPNLIARSLKTKTNNQFVFLCNEIRNSFYSQLVYSATQEAYKEGYSILFSNIIDDEAYLRGLCGYQVMGIFMPNGRISRKVVENLAKMGIPVVILADATWENAPMEIIQIRSAAEYVFPEIIQHMRKNGYERLHFVSGTVDAEHGLSDDKVKAFLTTTGLDASKDVSYGIATAQDAVEWIKACYADNAIPDGIICTNDSVAQGVIYGLSQLNIAVPDSVGVVGYDNTINSQFYIPSISSVDFGAEDLGKTIIQMLIQSNRGEKVEDLTIMPVFIPRKSSQRLRQITISK